MFLKVLDIFPQHWCIYTKYNYHTCMWPITNRHVIQHNTAIRTVENQIWLPLNQIMKFTETSRNPISSTGLATSTIVMEAHFPRKALATHRGLIFCPRRCCFACSTNLAQASQLQSSFGLPVTIVTIVRTKNTVWRCSILDASPSDFTMPLCTEMQAHASNILMTKLAVRLTNYLSMVQARVQVRPSADLLVLEDKPVILHCLCTKFCCMKSILCQSRIQPRLTSLKERVC